MKGKIVSYDATKGIGKLIIPKQGIKVFNIDEWKDYSKSPEVGLEIDFEINNNKIINIKVENTSTILQNLTAPVSYQIPYDLRIRETVSLNDCLELFFKKYYRIINKYEKYLNYHKSLPYKKIKRFIFTAYNNLIEIDMHINDKYLLHVKDSLEELEESYTSLLGEIKHPAEILLEKVFLKKQIEFQKLNKKFETNKKIITESLSTAKSLENKIKQLQAEMSGLSPKSDIYQTKEAELKGYKKSYVDLIDKAQNLKDENSILVKDITLFKEFYKKLFREIFDKKIDILIRILTKELNAITYEFDTILWKNAKNSRAIQHFFKDAKIEGSYSTKTFIRYYLKNLNSEKMNDKDNELLEILNELNVFSKTFIVFDRKRNRARDISSFIENMDHDSVVKIFDDLKQFILYIKENDSSIDCAMIEIETNTQNSINKIVHILNSIGVEVILFSETLNSPGIIHINNLFKELKEII